MALPEIPGDDPQSPIGQPMNPVAESPEAREIPTEELIDNMLAQRQPAAPEMGSEQPEEIDLASPMGRMVGKVALRQEQDSKYEEYKAVYSELTRGEFNRSQFAEDRGQFAEAQNILKKAAIRGAEVKSEEQKKANRELTVQGPSSGNTAGAAQINTMEDATQAAKNAARGL